MGKEILLRNKRINGPILGYIDDFEGMIDCNKEIGYVAVVPVFICS